MSRPAARAARLLSVLPVLVVLAACTSAPSGDPATRTSIGDTVKDSSSPDVSSPTPVLTPTAPAGTALGAGERVWAAFSERGVPRDAWWARLRPLLSDSARAVYVYDDPRNIPPMTITSKIRVAAKAPAEPHYTAKVLVPTSKGIFGLDLERHTVRSRWLLYAIEFPPAVD